MRTTKRKATAKQPDRLVLTDTTSGLPYGLGSLHFRNGSFWMIYRNAEGERVQVNTHTKFIEAARVMLAERALERVAVLTAHLEGVINEGKASLIEAGIDRPEVGTDAGNDRGSGRVGRRNQAASRDHRGAEVKA